MPNANGELARAKLALLDLYERGVSVNIAEWVGRHPQHRDELLDYWMWLSSTTRLTDTQRIAVAPGERIAEETLQRACMSVSLGYQWLEPSADHGDIEETLGYELERLRNLPETKTGRAPKPFRRAAVYAWIVSNVTKEQVSRLTVQKTAFLLERAMNLGLFTEHRRKRFGPYDHTARYKDAEPIASKKDWLRVQDTSLAPGDSAGEARKYAVRYLKSEKLAKQLLDILVRLSDSQLETWATVEWIAGRLAHTATAPTAEDVRAALKSMPEWSDKLGRANFTTWHIEEALSALKLLRLVPM